MHTHLFDRGLLFPKSLPPKLAQLLRGRFKWGGWNSRLSHPVQKKNIFLCHVIVFMWASSHLLLFLELFFRNLMNFWGARKYQPSSFPMQTFDILFLFLVALILSLFPFPHSHIYTPVPPCSLIPSHFSSP